jgi:hypothetical protein
MKVILSVPDEGYFERTWWRLFWAARIECRQIVDTVQCYAYADTICLYENQSYRFSLFGTCRNQVVNETIVIPLNETYGKNIYCYDNADHTKDYEIGICCTQH